MRRTARWGCAAAIAAGMTLALAATAGAQQPVGSWRLDEGAGTAISDSGPFGLDGTMPLTGRAAWIGGVEGTALRFDGNAEVALPDTSKLEPGRITIAAWVRRTGAPGAYSYVFSKGASSCVRSAYGLYTGISHGAAFYVAGDGLFTISPQVGASQVWDGRWHRLAGTFDGVKVRLFLDGREVGNGTPGPTHIEYGLSSRAAYIGTYRGACNLPFSGDLDEVTVWGSGLTRTQIAADAQPPAQTPPSGPVGPAPGPHPTGKGLVAVPGHSSTPKRCTSVKLSRRTVRARHRAAIVATVRRGAKRLKKVRVVMRAGHVRKSARTDRRGRARFVVRPSRTHKRLKIRVAVARRAGCGTPVAYVRVRPKT